ncbi:hypothetical protein HYX01_00110 [Candidatus Woesearchaeota archaeon]|nr:hypothetical protein [Candidatus Woesearchaeota archaeon]
MEDEVRKWMSKIEEVKKGSIDLSRDEDLSIALMNLISLEEHFFFTAMKTDNQKYLEMLKSVRELRKTLLAKIVTNPEGEEWCISKHLLAASMRLSEVGTKELSKGNSKEANFAFSSAFNLYSLFFAINLKMIDKEKLQHTEELKKESKIFSKFSEIIKKIVDCCKEW